MQNEAMVYTGTREELAGNDDLMHELAATERGIAFDEGMTREELISRMIQAEGIIREETNVLAGCLEKLQ